MESDLKNSGITSRKNGVFIFFQILTSRKFGVIFITSGVFGVTFTFEEFYGVENI